MSSLSTYTMAYVMAFDFGMKRIGVAIGQQLLNTATALQVITVAAGKIPWSEFDRLMDDWQPMDLVVGQPYLPNQPKHPIILAADNFCQQLSQRYHKTVHRMDEHLTTREAWSLATHEGGKPRDIDAIAAQLILTSWLAQSR